MSERASEFISEEEELVDAGRPSGTGILPSHAVRELVRAKAIQGVEDISMDQVQPASIDLRLGSTAYRMRASFLPGSRATVEDKIRNPSCARPPPDPTDTACARRTKAGASRHAARVGGVTLLDLPRALASLSAPTDAHGFPEDSRRFLEDSQRFPSATSQAAGARPRP